MATVLIVDDDKHTRALLRTIFTQDSRFARHELAVIEAGDGKEGLALFDDKRPAIVVTDLLMPKMDGFQLCEAIRGREHGQDTGLIVVSGVYRDLTASARVRDEFRGSFFAKPYQLADLASAVDQLLVNPQRKPAELAAPAAAEDLPASGSIADTPLPRLLLDFWERRATGALEIHRAGLEKRIDLVVGHPASVSSNQRTEALGEFLLARRIITPAQQQRALRRAHDKGEKLGESLVELQILSSAQLVKALTAQARAKIVSALRWQEGTWTYTPNRDLLDRHKGNALDPGPVVLMGLKQTGHLDDSIKAVDAVGGRPLQITSRGERLRPVIVRAFGDRLLAAIERPASVATILESWPDAATVMHTLEALLVTGCVEPTGGKPTGMTILPGPRPTARDPIALAGLSEAAGRRPSQAAGPAPSSKKAPAQPSRSGTIRAGSMPTRAPAAPPPLSGSAPRPRPALTRPSSAPPLGDAVPVPVPVLSVSALPTTPPTREMNSLMAELFADDSSAVNDFTGELPDAVPELIPDSEESGVIEVFGEAIKRPRPPGRAEVEAARELLLAEYLRVQGPDLYEVLRVSPDADDATLETEFKARTFDFSLERFATLDLGPDHGKLEEIHAAYRRARDILGDPERRAEYDARQGTPVGGTPALAGELAFHEGEKRLAEGDVDQAVQLFELALKQVPKAADYHAALGWAMYRRTREAVSASGVPPAAAAAASSSSTRATARLMAALAIDPDHAAAHEYLGRIRVESGLLDDEAARHLEKALAARPPRIDALLALDTLRTERKQFAALERQYRLLIHALGEDDHALALRLWLALAELYRTHLNDAGAARQALSAAARLAPDDPSIPRALDELTAGHPELWDERAQALRARWRLDPGDTEAGRTLFRGALELGRHDEAFVTAALLRMRDPEDTEAFEHYERLRPRFLARAVERRVSLEDWPALRHAEDAPDLAALFALLVELVDTKAPLPLAQLLVGSPGAPVRREVQQAPEAFARVRAWVAEVLGVVPPDVYLRDDFDDQVHAAAPSDGPPVLLCGPRALAQTDRVRLGFELARTMTYLWPGRGVAGSRPARRLRSVLLGCLASGGFGGFGGGGAAVGVAIDPEDTLAADSRAWMLGAPESRREDVRRLLGKLTAGRTNLNLSRWLHAMSRTADRVGLVMCGDPAVALRGAEAAGGAEAMEDLLEWARGREHLGVRDGLGRSIAV